jgi:hypothetical protein
MVLLSGYAMQTPTFFFPMDWEMMFWVMTTGGDGTDPITPSAGAGGWFDATYDALVNTLLVAGVVKNIPVNTSFSRL